jgi:hypothetical protein
MEKYIKNYALRYYISISAIIIGLALAFIGKYYFNNNLILSIGLGSIIGGTMTYIPNRNVYKDSNCRKKFEQTYDERFMEVGQKSSELAINIIISLIGVLGIITYIVPIQGYKICTILILLVCIIKYSCYKHYNNKYKEVEEISEQDIISSNSSDDFTIKKSLSILSITMVFIGILFSFEIANVYIGSFFIKQIGITNEMYLKIIIAIIILVFLPLGDYCSKTDYPKLNKVLNKMFGKMALISIILIVLNLFLNCLGVFK